MVYYKLSVITCKCNHFTAIEQGIIWNTDYCEKSEKQSFPQTFGKKINNFGI